MQIRAFSTTDADPVIALWERCDLTRPWNDPQADIDRKLNVQPHLFLIGESEGQIVATVMAGYEGHRGWMNYLGVDPDHQRKGYGRQIVEAAVALLEQEGCPKINLQIRDTNHEAIAFYQSLGFSTDPVISMGRRLIEDQK